MARESPLYIDAMDPVQLHWGKESWKNSLSATSSRLAVTFLAGSAYQYFRPVFYSENTTSIPRLVGKAEKRRRRRKERKGRVDDAQRLAQQFFSTIFKSLRYFFHEFPIWRLNNAPRLLRRNVDQKNCQSSIDVTGRSTFLAEEKRRNSSKSITNARQASSRKFRPPWLSPGPRRISMRPVL